MEHPPLSRVKSMKCPVTRNLCLGYLQAGKISAFTDCFSIYLARLTLLSNRKFACSTEDFAVWNANAE